MLIKFYLFMTKVCNTTNFTLHILLNGYQTNLTIAQPEATAYLKD